MRKFLIKFFCIFALAFAANIAKAENPQLKIKQFDGKIFDLAQQKGKITIVIFWAHWCQNCKRDMPVLDEVYRQYKSRGVEVIAVSIDDKRQRQKAEEAARKFSYPCAFSHDIINASFSKPDFVPTYYLIGKNGEFLKEIFTDENLSKPALTKILDKYL